jgi:hypothetical protein
MSLSAIADGHLTRRRWSYRGGIGAGSLAPLWRSMASNFIQTPPLNERIFPEGSHQRTRGPGVSERPPAEVKACAWTTAMGNEGEASS